MTWHLADGLSSGSLIRDDNNYNNRRNVNLNYEAGNDLRMAPTCILGNNLSGRLMKTYGNLYNRLCSYDNLHLALMKARKRKTLKDYVIEFESDLENNLLRLKHELESLSYAPSPLTTFIIRDPKTRRISASSFRDRVVHHALCNVIEPILSKGFIHDSFANQKGKGTCTRRS